MYPLSCLLGCPLFGGNCSFHETLWSIKRREDSGLLPSSHEGMKCTKMKLIRSFTWKPYDTERHNAGEVEWERVRYAHSRVLGKPRLCESVSSARYYRLHNPEILLAISISTWVNQRKITTAISKLEQSAPFSKADMLTKNLRFSQLLVSCGV